jgi:hypothetical protein
LLTDLDVAGIVNDVVAALRKRGDRRVVQIMVIRRSRPV